MITANKKDKVPDGHKRSSKWPKARKEFLSKNQSCAVCGGTKKLEVHHIMPFHLDENKELDPNNFITLCENKKDGVNCHLFFGHLGSFKSFNKDIVKDSAEWNLKIKNRPVDNDNNTKEQENVKS